MEKLKEKIGFIEILKSFWNSDIDEEEENEQLMEECTQEEKEQYKQAWKNIEKMMKESEKKHLGNKKRSDLKVNTKPYKMKQNEKEQIEKEDNEIEI